MQAGRQSRQARNRAGPSVGKGKPLAPEEERERRVAAQQKRKKNREERAAKLAEERVEHPAPTTCPNCQSAGPFTALSPDISNEIEYITEHLIHLTHVLEKKVCTCGHIFSAPTPQRVTEGCHYGPGLHAHAVVSKCADAMPLNRIAKRFERDAFERVTMDGLTKRADLTRETRRRI